MRGSQELLAGTLTLVVVVSMAGTGVAVPSGAQQPAPDGAPAVDGAAAATQSNGDNLTQTRRYSLTPDQPGQVELRLSYEVPDRVGSLQATLLEEADVIRTDGFTRNGSSYEWDGTTSTPSLTIRYNPNETIDRSGPEAADGRYLFADVGEWALFRQFRTNTRWSAPRDDPVTFERTLETDGPGATADQLVYLGEVSTSERMADEQTIRLVVPEAAELSESRSAILDSMADASASFRVGDRDSDVVAFAAPTDRIEWGVRGAAYRSDFWVRDFERLDTADNVWLHEYVHTRQAFSTTSETRWLTEATAQYYAALLTLEQDRIGFDAFRQQLADGERSTYSDVVLSEPATWTRHANYVKGALAAGRIDESLRDATNQSGSLERVMRELNRRSGPVAQAEFLDIVAATGGAEPRARTTEITETSESLSTWDKSTHSRLFGPLPARVSYALPADGDGYRTSGPYRNDTVTSTPVRLAAGETLTADTVVRNTGTETGEYNATLTVDGATVSSASGSIAGESERTVPLSHTFEQTGEYTLGAGEETVSVVVEPAAEPTVSSVSANRTRLRQGERATVTATVANDAAVPANGTVAFTRDGEAVASQRVTLTPGNTTQLSATVTFPDAGERQVSAGSADPVTVTVEATTESATGAGNRGTSSGDGPGFTAPVAVLAIVLALLARRA